jgi:beta-lactamase regulating signal transducer with metallopeptidase domain
MNVLTAWLLMFVVHASVLLLVAWAIDAAFPSLRGAWRELLWRTALFGCALTATVQTLAPPHSYFGRWHWAATTISVPRDAATTPAATNPPTSVATTTGATRPATLPPLARTSIQAPTAAETVRSVAPATPLDWAAVFFGVWLLGAFIALARIASRFLRLRSELARAVPVASAEALEDAATLAARTGVTRPQLLILEHLPSPVALTGARIVLPAWALETLDRAQLQAMLAHELGHLVRGDPQWKLLTACWRALLWIVPPAAIAQRRLDESAELACDAFAARHTGNGRSLAECLASCAEHHVHGYVTGLAPAMASRPSSLTNRIERLLEGVSMDSSGSGALARGVAAIALGVAAFGLPAVGFESARAQAATQSDTPAAKAAPSHSSVSIHNDDNGRDTMTVSFSDDHRKFKANIDGKIAFSDDETDISSLGGNGTATIEETVGGVTRRVELAERGGKLERRYFVDGSEHPIDDAGRKWIASAVLQLVRSGIGAEDRAKRLYSQGGAKRVLDEIAQIPTDYVRGLYLRTLMGLGKLAPDELDRAIKLAGDLHTDYERRQALSAVSDKQALDAPQQVTFLHQALRFDSDYERAESLTGIVPRLANTNDVRQAWLDAALKVKSDYERRRTLQAMLNRGGLDDAQLASIIEASNSMGSDYEHRELLVAAARRLHDPDRVAESYARSAQKIGSDYERREALMALMQSGKLGTASATAILDSAAGIHSGYECREVLVALARVMPDDAALQARYRAVAQKLPDYERQQAENALVR